MYFPSYASLMDPWRVLGVPRYSDAVECRKAFHALALKYHPDVNPSPSAARDFQLVHEAYEFLKASNFSRVLDGGGGMGGGGSGMGGGFYSSPRGAGYAGGAESSARARARGEAFRAWQAAAQAEAEAMRGQRPPMSPRQRAAHYVLDIVFHPRVMFIAIPLLALLSYTMVSRLAFRHSGSAPDEGAELAMGVFNKKTRRWEVPTHRDYFHERLVLVRKDMLNPSTPPPASPRLRRLGGEMR